jgi:hypothetical protein
MVLTIAAFDSAGMVDNWILGRADLRLRFSSGIYCSLHADCGRMYVCAFSADGDDGDGDDGDGDDGDGDDGDDDGVGDGDHSTRST